MLSILLQAAAEAAAGAATAKLGAAIGAGIAAIGAGSGIGKIGGSAMEAIGRPGGGGLRPGKCTDQGFLCGGRDHGRPQRFHH